MQISPLVFNKLFFTRDYDKAFYSSTVDIIGLVVLYAETKYFVTRELLLLPDCTPDIILVCLPHLFNGEVMTKIQSYERKQASLVNNASMLKLNES